MFRGRLWLLSTIQCVIERSPWISSKNPKFACQHIVKIADLFQALLVLPRTTFQGTNISSPGTGYVSSQEDNHLPTLFHRWDISCVAEVTWQCWNVTIDHRSHHWNEVFPAGFRHTAVHVEQHNALQRLFLFPSNPDSPSENGEPTNLAEMLIPQSFDNVIGSLGFDYLLIFFNWLLIGCNMVAQSFLWSPTILSMVANVATCHRWGRKFLPLEIPLVWIRH